MKIIEKKCPNCSANLKFSSGDRSAHCDSCRRDFIIEYEAEDVISDIKAAAAKLSANDFNLAPATTIFGKIFAIHTVIIVAVSLMISIAIIFGIIHTISTFDRMNKTETNYSTDYNKAVEQMNRQYEEARRQMEERQGSPISD